MSSIFISNKTPDGTSYELSGAIDAPVVVLIHGLGLCKRIWDPLVPELSKNYRVLNYDLYGHGESAPCVQTTNLKVYANQLAGMLAHLNIPRAVIVGFSIGGMINRRFAMDYPDTVSALAIFNSPHDRGAEKQKMAELRAKKVREHGAFSTFEDALKRWFTPGYLAAGFGSRKVTQWLEQVDPESYAQAVWVLANGVRELIDPKPPITAKTLVLTCENDIGSTPQMSQDISAEIKASKLVIVPNLQHLGLMEQPDLFAAEIIGFLDGLNLCHKA